MRHFFKRATDQVEAAIAHTRAPPNASPAISRQLPRRPPASRAFRDDVANFRPATEIYEQNTLTAAQRVRELIDEGTRAARSGGYRPPSSVKW